MLFDEVFVSSAHASGYMPAVYWLTPESSGEHSLDMHVRTTFSWGVIPFLVVRGLHGEHVSLLAIEPDKLSSFDPRSSWDFRLVDELSELASVLNLQVVSGGLARLDDLRLEFSPDVGSIFDPEYWVYRVKILVALGCWFDAVQWGPVPGTAILNLSWFLHDHPNYIFGDDVEWYPRNRPLDDAALMAGTVQTILCAGLEFQHKIRIVSATSLAQRAVLDPHLRVVGHYTVSCLITFVPAEG